MTLQERLREQGQITKTVVLGAPADSRVLSERFIPDPLCHEAADALDAKDARIKELEGALREWLEADDAVTGTINNKEYSMPKGTRLVAAYSRARAALKG